RSSAATRPRCPRRRRGLHPCPPPRTLPLPPPITPSRTVSPRSVWAAAESRRRQRRLPHRPRSRPRTDVAQQGGIRLAWAPQDSGDSQEPFAQGQPLRQGLNIDAGTLRPQGGCPQGLQPRRGEGPRVCQLGDTVTDGKHHPGRFCQVPRNGLQLQEGERLRAVLQAPFPFAQGTPLKREAAAPATGQMPPPQKLDFSGSKASNNNSNTPTSSSTSSLKRGGDAPGSGGEGTPSAAKARAEAAAKAKSEAEAAKARSLAEKEAADEARRDAQAKAELKAREAALKAAAEREAKARKLEEEERRRKEEDRKRKEADKKRRAAERLAEKAAAAEALRKAEEKKRAEKRAAMEQKAAAAAAAAREKAEAAARREEEEAQ
ncbi:unnamed protein product, partial [Ectocarpus sp. 12 AP-2014]